MQTARLSPGRTVGVRLTDVPEGIRRRAGEAMLRREDDPVRRYEILMAMVRPSERVYFLPAEAVERVCGHTPRPRL